MAPKFFWDQDHVSTMKSASSLPAYYEYVFSLLDDFSLVHVHMVSEPTRGEYMLDYFLTQNPTLVNNIQSHAGLEVIKLEYSLKLKIKRNDWLLADICPQAEEVPPWNGQ